MPMEKAEYLVGGGLFTAIALFILRLIFRETFIRRSEHDKILNDERAKHQAEFDHIIRHDVDKLSAAVKDMERVLTVLMGDVKAIRMRRQMPGAASQDQEYR